MQSNLLSVLFYSSLFVLPGAQASPVLIGSSVVQPVERAAAPVVTDQAYINTVLRHHNVHRANHSAAALTWSPTLAKTAMDIASTCVYQHNTTAGGGGYGQNIGAGYAATAMGQFITTGLYNGEVNAYTYFGKEPNINTLGQWGHFSQVVWKGSKTVGCYTNDCTKTGLKNAPGINTFTVCNYGPPGNYIGQFAANVGTSLKKPSVNASYGCTSAANCVGTTTT